MENSPGLWPQACQILDMNQSIKKSIIQSTLGSWFLVFGAWVLGPIVFLIHRARIWGCARGGSRATFLGSLAFIRPYNFVLKSLLFLIPFFFDFGSILGAKMTPKIHKNPQKVVFEIAPHFESIFEPIFIDFSFDFRPPAKVKTRLKPWSVVRFYTFPIFVLSFLLGSILDHLGLHFGVVLDSFFSFFSLPRPIKKSTIFCLCFSNELN